MKLLSHLCMAALLAASAGSALADTIHLESYGSASPQATGANNSATFYFGYDLLPGLLPITVPGTVIGGGPSYSVGTGGVWASPTGTSSWVSNDPNAYPGGSVSPQAGTYLYYTDFTDLTPGSSTGTLTLLADDTASVYLNGKLVQSAAANVAAAHCDVSTPNCTTPVTFDLTGFQQGNNILAFAVNQQHGSAEGLDFSGSVTTTTAVTPEPSSLLLLATGVLAGGALLYRRRVGAQAAV